MVKIAEIFNSTQGEGFHAGHAAVFIRLSGCNLKCPFCDTDHSGFDMEESEVVSRVETLRGHANVNLVIFTGGEPSLQMDSIKAIIDGLKANGYKGTFAVESNGTCPPAKFREAGIDFVTISPKCLWVSNPIASGIKDQWSDASEIKCLYDTTLDPEVLHSFLNEVASLSEKAPHKPHLYLQPITDHKNDEQTHINIHAVLNYITLVDARWSISMQLQNIWHVR